MADGSAAEDDVWSVPLIALNIGFRKKLGLYLNPKNAVAADWMGLAEAMGFTYLEIKNFETVRNPTMVVLENWQARCADATVGRLLSILMKEERNDIVEDLRPLIGTLRELSGSITNCTFKLLCQYLIRGVIVQSLLSRKWVMRLQTLRIFCSYQSDTELYLLC